MPDSQNNGKEKARSDRCVNPLKIKGHTGKALRIISKRLLETFPHLPANAKVSKKCVDMCYEESNSQMLDTSSQEVDNSEEEVEFVPYKRKCSSREDELEQLLTGLKEKFSTLPENDPLRMSILTIAPDCWPIRKIQEEFNTSYRMAQKSKKLKRDSGVLGTPIPKKGKNLLESTVKSIQEFYESDINSRIMPNKKDVLSVKIDGQKQTMQKRLLLSDVKVLHEQFKEQNPGIGIGLSKFAELRSKWCVLAGASGTRSVCVCVIHENFKLMLESVDFEILTKNSQIQIKDYSDCLKFITCKDALPACYLNECESCPEIKNFSDYITTILKENGITQIIYSVWQSTDRCTLKKECLSVEGFVDELCIQLEKLLPHHFISKNQSEYLLQRKSELTEEEVLVQCDFSENYAFVVQNAAQAFHYNNDQCTVHPVVVYYRSGKEIEHSSFIMLSDSTTHDATAVYMMQEMIMPEIKKVCPGVKKVIYFTDGAKQHYKNRFQMVDLMEHEQEFGIKAEWHFHATAHGKGACDGVGAILKREATRASLQAEPSEAILTSLDLFKWAEKKFTNMKFFYYSKEMHRRMQKKLAKRFLSAPSVTKIQNGHAFIPINSKKMEVKRYSGALKTLSIVEYEV